MSYVEEGKLRIVTKQGQALDIDEYLDESDVWRPANFEWAWRCKRTWWHGTGRDHQLVRTSWRTAAGISRVVIGLSWSQVATVSTRELDREP